MKKKTRLEIDKFVFYFKVAYFFAKSDLKSRHNQSFFGSMWIILSVAIPAAALSVIWVKVMGVPKDKFIPYFILGFVIWQLLSSIVVQSPSLFLKASPIINITPVPFYFFTQELLMGKFIEARSLIIIILFVCALFPQTFTFSLLNTALLIYGILLTFFSLFGLAHILGFLGAKYADLEQIINSSMSVIFFFTPVIYFPERLQEYQFVLYYNPFFYLIESIRQPLINEHPDPLIYSTLTFMCAIIITASAVFSRKWSKECALWL